MRSRNGRSQFGGRSWERRKHAKQLIPACAFAALIFLGFAVGTVRANPNVQCICPTCNPFGQHCSSGCPMDSYTIYVYTGIVGTAQVAINGTDYSNGALVLFCSTIHYTIGAVISSPYQTFAFSYWKVFGAGSVASASSSTTTFTPASTNQVGLALDMVLGPGANSINTWGGYVASGSNITEAWGTFDIPTGPYYQEPNLDCGIENTIGIWVGIGGLDNSQYLWQAGVQIQIAANSQCLGALSMQEWYETDPGSIHYVGGTPCDGSEYPFGVDIGVDAQGAWVDYGSCGVTQISGVQFTPDKTTAEWVVEVPLTLGPSPNFPNFSFFDCGYTDGGTTYSSFAAPIESVTLTHELALSGNYAQFDQSVTPSYVGTDNFTEEYSQSYIP